MSRQHRADNLQPHARAARLPARGKERLEDPLAIARADPSAIVGDEDS